MQFSPRLSKIAALVPKCDTLADIGTDHGYVPICCLKDEKIKKAIACDVNAGPLKRAEQNFENHKLSHLAELRLGDGLSPLSEGEADVFVIAGMGALLICDILEKGKDKISDDAILILQPMIAPIELRKYLFANGFSICDEYVVPEEDKYYNIMVAKKGSTEPCEELLYIGKNLRTNSPGIICDYLDYKIGVCQKIINGHRMSKNPDKYLIDKYTQELMIYQKYKEEADR